jgi:hypothetical protein
MMANWPKGGGTLSSGVSSSGHPASGDKPGNGIHAMVVGASWRSGFIALSHDTWGASTPGGRFSDPSPHP